MAPVAPRIHRAMAAAALGGLCNMLTLVALAYAVDALMLHSRQMPWRWLLAAALAAVASYTLRLQSFQLSHLAAFRLETILRTRLSEHIAAVPLGVAQRIGSGALAKVMQDDVRELHIFVADSTPLYARAYVMPLLTLLALCWLDWRLCVAACAILVAGVAVLGVAMRNHAEMTRRYNGARERVSAAIVEFIQAMPVVRSFDTGGTTFGRYQTALEAYRDVLVQWYRQAGFSSRFSIAILSPMPTVAALLWLGAWLTWQQSLSFGVWLAILLLGTGMSEAMLPMMTLYQFVSKARLSVARINEILALPTLAVAPVDGPAPIDASVHFKAVSFRYAAGDRNALEDVSFHAASGSITALVGPSGAGKSTVARLLPRFWEIDQGAIKIGGVDIRALSEAQLMEQVAFVFQDTFLFNDTIANNIRLGMPHETDAAVRAAAAAAQADAFITALPAGYDTLAGERGVFLSGGQRQRITIARAILQNRPILVLDEATAFTDPENEAAIVAALSALCAGKTVLIVAHRLSTIVDADQILVFDQGRLAAAGTHTELLDKNEVYARLWRKYQASQQWVLRGAAAASTSIMEEPLL